MKKIVFIFLGLLVSNTSVFATDYECLNNYGRQESDYYFNTNKDKQIGTEEFRNLTPKEQREAKIRNLCFGASTSWHTFCAWKNCIDSNKKIFRHTLNEYCNWAKLDCFTDDIENIVSVMHDSDDYVFKMFFSDMNDVTADIANGKAQIAYLDTDNAICYKTDDNGDTIWHAFIKNNKDHQSWWNQCLSFLKNSNLEKLLEATYKTKNKNGRTAVQEAMEKGGKSKAQYLLQTMSGYYKQEKLNCGDLAHDISSANNISFDDAKKLIQQCY